MSEPIGEFPKAEHPKGLTRAWGLMVIFVGLSFGLGIRSYVADQTQADQRNDDRIASDIAACERGNDNKAILRTLSAALTDYPDDILAAVEDFAQLDATEKADLAHRLEPARARINEAITKIKDTDCKAVVPGA